MAFNEARKIREAQKKAEREIRGMVVVMGNEGLNHYKKSWTDQGFTDETLERWKPRKRQRYRGRNENTRAILVKTGRLRRSLRKITNGRFAVNIYTNVPYASIHNEGLGRMPKRKFVGYSGRLNRRLIEKFNTKINSIFK